MGQPRVRPTARLVNPLIKTALALLCHVDGEELSRVPTSGPLILAINHTNFLEVPLLYTHLLPRRVIGLVKRETWNNPLLGRLGDLWEAIAIDREANDLGAMRRALAVLEAGGILILAPEGTRSGDGRLQRGHAGVVQLLAHSEAAVLPLAHFGGEAFWPNLRRLRATPFHIRVGRPLTLRSPAGGLGKTARQEAADELMAHLAALLPESYRGAYRAAVPPTGRYFQAEAE